MESIITDKLGAGSMTQGQRVHWLAAQLVVAKEPDLAPVEDFVEEQTSAVAGFFAFYEGRPVLRLLLDRLPSAMLGRFLGVRRPPLGRGRSDPDLIDFKQSDLVRSPVEELGMRPDDDAESALADLVGDPGAAVWRPTIRRVQQERQVLCRDARYRHPDADAVCHTLENRQPANATDLAAVTLDCLGDIAGKIRHGNTNDRRQYWNPGEADRSRDPGHENDCRDALLSDLQERLLRLGIDTAPEGRHADEKRSDIRVTCNGFSVPVEIKKSDARDLWSAARSQLIAKYTGAGGGIFLVLWFGNEPRPCQMPGSGLRPRSVAELEERLRGALSPAEACFVSIRVIDIASP